MTEIPLTPENTEADDLGISSGFAARLLAARLGEAEFIWLQRLANWRKPGRKQRIPWVERKSGHPRYQFEDVRTFIEQELAKRPPTGVTAERTESKSAAIADVEDGIAFVRVFWSAKTAAGSFTLTTEAAETLAKGLAAAVAKARDIQQQRGPCYPDTQ